MLYKFQQADCLLCYDMTVTLLICKCSCVSKKKLICPCSVSVQRCSGEHRGAVDGHFKRPCGPSASARICDVACAYSPNATPRQPLMSRYVFETHRPESPRRIGWNLDLGINLTKSSAWLPYAFMPACHWPSSGSKPHNLL